MGEWDFTHTADITGTVVVIRGQKYTAVNVERLMKWEIVWRSQCAGCGQSFTTKSRMQPQYLVRVCDRCA